MSGTGLSHNAIAKISFGRLVGACWTESRPVVQLVFMMRFLVGALSSGVSLGAHWPRVLVGLTAWTAAVLAAYLINGVMDVTEDRANGSSRPIARGDLPENLALGAVAGLAAFSLVVGLSVPGLVWCVLGFLLVGYAYSGPPWPAKRHGAACTGAVILLGLFTYAAGSVAAGGAPTVRTVVLGVAMSLWMGLVGAVSKDLSDVPGDTLAGRRTLAVVHGERTARLFTAVAALTVATGTTVTAALVAPGALVAAVPLSAGAIWVAVRCLRPTTGRGRPGRGPYRAFMVTQYAVHAVVAVGLLIT